MGVFKTWNAIARGEGLVDRKEPLLEGSGSRGVSFGEKVRKLDAFFRGYIGQGQNSSGGAEGSSKNPDAPLGGWPRRLFFLELLYSTSPSSGRIQW